MACNSESCTKNVKVLVRNPRCFLGAFWSSDLTSTWHQLISRHNSCPKLSMASSWPLNYGFKRASLFCYLISISHVLQGQYCIVSYYIVFVWESHPAELRIDSWLCAQVSLWQGSGKLMQCWRSKLGWPCVPKSRTFWESSAFSHILCCMLFWKQYHFTERKSNAWRYKLNMIKNKLSCIVCVLFIS